jgi:fucose 4-O-acetylase-like acetyltransferase
MQRNEFLDFTKGVLIVLVGIGHAMQYVVYHNNDFWEDPIFKAIYIFHMPLFMAVAGYLSFRGLTQTPDLIKYVRQRLVSYLLPIVVWATLFQTLMFLTVKHDPLQNLPLAIFFEVVWSLWFLWSLIGCLLCAAIAQAAKGYRWLVFLLLFWGVLALPDQWNIYLFQYTFPFFVGGFYLATLKSRVLQTISLNPLTFQLLGIASGLCFILWGKNTYVYVTEMSLSPENLPHVILRWLSGGIVSAFVMLILFHLNAIIPKIFKRPLTLFGRDSMYIYILQSYVFLALLALSERYLHQISGGWRRDLIAIILGVVVVGGCWYLGQLISKDKITARLLFGKARPAPKTRLAPVNFAWWFWLRYVVQRSRD